MRRPKQFQLAFNFRPQVETLVEAPSVYNTTFANLENREPLASHFVRRLHEPISVCVPADAAHHLMAHIFYPFNTFDHGGFMKDLRAVY